MKCKVEIADFARELSLLEKVVGKKPTIAVLANVLIEVNANALVMSATDLEVGLVGACLAEVDEPGSLTLPAKKLTEIVKAQSGEAINLSTDSRGGVTFKSAKFRSRLQSLPPDDFPGIPEIEGTVLELPKEDMKDMIPRVRYAISKSDSRYFLAGVYMGLPDGEFLLASTDGPRLSLTRAARQGDESQDAVLVPTKAIDQLAALLAEEGEDDVIQFSQGDRHLFFEVDGRLMVSRQVTGKFPDYERIIPKEEGNTATLNREALISVLKRLVLIDPTVNLHFSENLLEVSSVGQGIGEGVEDVPAIYDGPEFEKTYNGEYLLDFASCATGLDIRVSFTSTNKPLLLRDGGNYKNIVMGVNK